MEGEWLTYAQASEWLGVLPEAGPVLRTAHGGGGSQEAPHEAQD